MASASRVIFGLGFRYMSRMERSHRYIKRYSFIAKTLSKFEYDLPLRAALPTWVG